MLEPVACQGYRPPGFFGRLSRPFERLSVSAERGEKEQDWTVLLSLGRLDFGHASSLTCRDRRHGLVRNRDVRGNVLDVVVIVEGLDQAQHRSRGGDVLDFDGVRRYARELLAIGLDLSCGQRVADGLKGVWRADDLK